MSRLIGQVHPIRLIVFTVVVLLAQYHPPLVNGKYRVFLLCTDGLLTCSVLLDRSSMYNLPADGVPAGCQLPSLPAGTFNQPAKPGGGTMGWERV